jgi:hypothetical protein
MRVLLKLILDCDPDAAWRAIRSPTVMREVVFPWLDFDSLEPNGFPLVWEGGDHLSRVLALDAVPVGTQNLALSFMPTPVAGVRMLRDTGGGRSGLMRVLSRLDHRMAISADPAGPGPDGTLKTLYRDQLIVRAGLLTPALWYSAWAFWQWRGIRLRQLAPTWAYDPPPEPENPDEPRDPADPHDPANPHDPTDPHDPADPHDPLDDKPTHDPEET